MAAQKVYNRRHGIPTTQDKLNAVGNKLSCLGCILTCTLTPLALLVLWLLTR